MITDAWVGVDATFSANLVALPAIFLLTGVGLDVLRRALRVRGLQAAWGAGGILVGLILAATYSLNVFLLLLVMSILGLMYAVPLVPPSLGQRIRLRRLKDIPSSKTLSVSGGWALILARIRQERILPAVRLMARLS